MRRARINLAISIFAAAAGILGGTYGYGAYYRGEHYRHRVEAALTKFFGLPTTVGAIEPHTLRSRVLSDVEMYLPDHRARIFWCPRAIWDAATAEGIDGTTLRLHESVLTVGSEHWESEDYMRVLRASLLHNFSDLDIDRVEFINATLTWPRKDFRLRVNGMNGRIDFDEHNRGVAELSSRSLNGIAVTEPIRIRALIDPGSDQDFLPEVTLEVPPLPLAGLGLNSVLGSPVTQGSFAGKVTLHQSPQGDTIELKGLAQGVRLDELTHGLAGGPLTGTVDLTIHEAIIREQHLERLRFNGEIRGLNVDPLLERYNLPAIGGQVDLQLLNGLIEDENLLTLVVSGDWRQGSLGVLTRYLLGAPIEGRLSVRIHSLVVQEGQLASGNIDLTALPPKGQAGHIDRDLLLGLLEKHLKVKVPQMLASLIPESIEYVRGEAKLLIDGTTLQMLNLARPTGEAILTIRVGGQELPLVPSIDQTFNLAPMIERARQRAIDWRDRLRQPATQPHTD